MDLQERTLDGLLCFALVLLLISLDLDLLLGI